MPNSNILSNYDREILKKIKESKLLIIDLDGTLIDFEKIDNIIIAQLFPENRIINSIDNILWKINRLDLIGNGYLGLKIRLKFYSLFSKYSYIECKEKYSKMYERFAKEGFYNVYCSTLIRMLNNGYDIKIVTKNVYAKNLFDKNFFIIKTEDRIKLNLIVLNETKKKQFLNMVEMYGGKVCVIGNNLSDDIINSYKIKAPYIYIGKSKAVKFILSVLNKLFGIKGIQVRSFNKLKSIFIK